MDDAVNPKPDSKQSLYYVNDDLGKPITNFRLNGNNYLSWSYAVEHFIRAKKKSKILTDDPPNSNDSTYEDWMASNSMVLTWLWNSMEPKVLTNVQFLPTAKQYSVYKDQILASERYPQASTSFFRLKRKRLEHGEFVPVAKESSALLSTPSNRGGRGGFGGGRGFNGRGARGNSGFGRGNRGGFGGRRGRGDRYDGTDERKCTYCGKDGHTEPFCWDKHGKPAYAHNAYDQTFGSSAAGPSSASPPSTAEVLGQILNRLN
ncbi:hypothetical protein IFM89_012785 [Coptis chinensis]|uniref:Retrotransposon Copia-like N-terminal domain-containing protein n=1 Tax=Coptis chinensis TaxID=261450 RepID=A0A835LHS4_9MAGN|nr:hypothetical protein IFM89_012785 [Coptis chinensis]